MRNTGQLTLGEKKLEKFNFENMKAAALSNNPALRKRAFIEYFERFAEFPTFLFETTGEIDNRLIETIQDLQTGTHMTKEFQKGIDLLLQRLRTE